MRPSGVKAKAVGSPTFVTRVWVKPSGGVPAEADLAWINSNSGRSPASSLRPPRPGRAGPRSKAPSSSSGVSSLVYPMACQLGMGRRTMFRQACRAFAFCCAGHVFSPGVFLQGTTISCLLPRTHSGERSTLTVQSGDKFGMNHSEER